MAPLPDDLLRAFLAGRDFDCPICGYNIRDLQTDVCPECGRQIQLQVGAVEPRQAICVVGLIGLAAGAGFSGLLVVYVGIRLLIDRYPPVPDRFIYLTVLPLVVESALLYLWLRRWKQIRQLPRSISGPLVIACWAASLINVVFFAIWIR